MQGKESLKLKLIIVKVCYQLEWLKIQYVQLIMWWKIIDEFGYEIQSWNWYNSAIEVQGDDLDDAFGWNYENW